MYNKTKTACAVAAVLSTMVASPLVLAQDAAQQEVETIAVTGIRSSVAKSMDVKRSSAGVVDAISAEDIGDFPDTNLAESLQRITGVSIDRSGGEGQLITVRGFGPQFNTVLVNGRQMASENQSRAFSFDTIASELVSSLDVHKTSTATMQSGGVGSTINVNTARPFALGGFKVAGSVKGVYDENSESTTPQLSGLISNTFNDDTFGVLLAVSHQERETRLNQAQIDGWLENVGVPNPVTESGEAWDGNVFSPRNYDHKVTFEDRTRTNANLVLQYAPSDDLVITADALYSKFDVESNATSYGHWFTAPNIQGVADDGSLFDANGDRLSPTVDANGTVIDLYQEVGLATDMHAKTFDRLTDTLSLGLNFDYQYNDNLNLKFDLSHSTAEREANNGGGDQLSLIGYANRVRFQVDDNILPVASMFADANANIYSGQQEIDGAIVASPVDGFPAYDSSLTPAGVSDLLDKDNSRAHVMLRRGWAVEDEVTQLRFDGEYFTDNGGITEIRFGTQYSNETKSLTRWDNEGVGIHCTYCGYPDLPEIPADAQYVFNAGNDFLSSVSGSGRMPTSWLAHNGEANFAFLENYYQSVNGSAISFDAVRRNNSFDVEEQILSAYVEMDFEGEVGDMLLSGTAGFRYESTDVSVTGTEAPIIQLTVLDQTEMLAQYGEAQPIDVDADYDVILPNFSMKLEITDDLIARAAVSTTITRPTLESMSPVTVITTTRQGGDLTSTSGNPGLEPFESDNFDLSVEWYYDIASYASIGYFRKHVSNFIVNSQEDRTFTLSDGSLLTDPSTGTDSSGPDGADSVAVFTNTLPNNGENAIVDGFELAWQHSFDSGFGVLANATLVDSDAKLDPYNINQVFALTGLSDSYNLVGFYENDDFMIRLAYNWRGEFVQSLTQSQGDGPTIVEDYQQLDLSASYELSDSLGIFFEGINLTEEYVHKRGRFSNHMLLVEDSGRRWAFGVRGSF
ncbi:TonB-dependent receptor [Marisediminitalea aggregata]|uniref:TonB-dependent receptor n=1 Tax=Marisediminitalea aggregata TaxID=634436 RepID=A0A1M5HKF4_9ALTE|nr:TonB-dependent receptor [Marisediminitalea aggregata]SHG16449.1 TonB-dependent receptor [Marisediminitalea aggregata]